MLCYATLCCVVVICRWKNNIERKAKFRSLLKDGNYRGTDDKHQQRALYCQVSLSIASNVRSHFERFVKGNRGVVRVSFVPHENVIEDTIRQTSPGDHAQRILAYLHSSDKTTGVSVREGMPTHTEAEAKTEVETNTGIQTVSSRGRVCGQGSDYLTESDDFIDPSAVAAAQPDRANASNLGDQWVCIGDHSSSKTGTMTSGYPAALLNPERAFVRGCVNDSDPSEFDDPSSRRETEAAAAAESEAGWAAQRGGGPAPKRCRVGNMAAAGALFVSSWRGRPSSATKTAMPVRRKSSVAVTTKYPSVARGAVRNVLPHSPHGATSAQFDSFSPASYIHPGLDDSNRSLLTSPDTVTGFDHGEDQYEQFSDASDAHGYTIHNAAPEIDPYVAQGGALSHPGPGYPNPSTILRIEVGTNNHDHNYNHDCRQQQRHNISACNTPRYLHDLITDAPDNPTQDQELDTTTSPTSADFGGGPEGYSLYDAGSEDDGELEFELFRVAPEVSPGTASRDVNTDRYDEDCMSTENCAGSDFVPNHHRTRSLPSEQCTVYPPKPLTTAVDTSTSDTGDAFTATATATAVPRDAPTTAGGEDTLGDTWFALLSDIVKLE